MTGVRSAASAPRVDDTALRDGGQTAGVVFSSHGKIRIAELLDDVGVHQSTSRRPHRPALGITMVRNSIGKHSRQLVDSQMVQVCLGAVEAALSLPARGA